MLALVVHALDLLVTARGQDPHPLDQWALRYTRPSGQPLCGAAYGDGVYMAVGSGALLTSFDAVDWTETSQGTSTLTDVLFANHRFTVIGGHALIFSTTDVGALITSNAPPAMTNVPINFSCVAYANGAFLASTASGTILQSGPLSPPSVAPRFTSSPVSVLADGTVALWLIVPEPGPLILEWSADLRHWSPLPGPINATGLVSIQDPTPPGTTQRYYRARSAGP